MDDPRIIALYWERSEHAIIETKSKYGKLIQYIALHILHDNSDAEECENDTYLGAWDSIPPRKPENLKNYLARIARNLALKKYHYLHAQKRNPNVIISLEELEGVVSDKSSGAEELSDTELAETINSFLESLDQESRRVFLLRYWYFASVKEVQQLCGFSKSKTESMLFRTRNKLKQYLMERGYEQ